MRIIAFNGGACRSRCQVSIRRIRGTGGPYYDPAPGGVTDFDFELVGGVGSTILGEINYTTETEDPAPVAQLTVGQLLPVDGSLPWGDPSATSVYGDRWIRDHEYRSRSGGQGSFSATGRPATDYRTRTRG